MNLLPDIEKDLLKKGLHRRFLIFSSFMIVAALLVSLVALLPAYVLARVKLVEIVSKAKAAMASDDKKTSELLLALPNEVKAKLRVLETSIPEQRTAGIFYELTNVVPEGVTLKSTSFTRNATLGGKRGKTISFSGLATDRKSLIDFSDRLKSVNLVSNVDMPVSNLTRERNLPFLIKVFIMD